MRAAAGTFCAGDIAIVIPGYAVWNDGAWGSTPAISTKACVVVLVAEVAGGWRVVFRDRIGYVYGTGLERVRP